MQHEIRTLVAMVVVSLVAMVPTEAQDASPAASETGLSVGAKAPSFQLQDQDGRERSLSEFIGNDKVALVFYRSADW